MITNKMKKWLEGLPQEPDRDVKYCVYLNRIQKRVDLELYNLLWLCANHPEIFLDRETEINDLTGKIVSHRRLKKLLVCIKKLNPTCDVELVMEKIDTEPETQPAASANPNP